MKDYTKANIRLSKVYERSLKPVYKHLNPLEKRYIKLNEVCETERKNFAAVERRSIDYDGVEFRQKYQSLLNKYSWQEVEALALETKTGIYWNCWLFYDSLSREIKAREKLLKFTNRNNITTKMEANIWKNFFSHQRKLSVSF